jgi:hypothetical protein
MADPVVAGQRQAANLLASPAVAPLWSHVQNTDHVNRIVLTRAHSEFFDRDEHWCGVTPVEW